MKTDQVTPNPVQPEEVSSYTWKRMVIEATGLLAVIIAVAFFI
ncbi:hypothetical protein [Oleiharenicola lentus]